MLIVDKALEHRFDVLTSEHCERQRKYKISASVAILIGFRSDEDDFVVSIPSCPIPETVLEQDNVQADDLQSRGAKSTGAVKAASDCVDSEWIAQHVQQVMRTLPGGLDVLGLALFGDRSALNQLRPTLLHCVRAVHRAALRMLWRQPLVAPRAALVTVEAPLGKPVVTVINDVEHAAGISQTRLVYQVLRWQRASCQLGLDGHLKISEKFRSSDFLRQFQSAVSPLVQSIIRAEYTINGRLRDGDDCLFVKPTKKTPNKSPEQSAPSEEFTVDLFTRYTAPNGTPLANIVTEEPNCGFMQVKGSLQCKAVAPQKATVSQLIRAVKQDLLRSLYARCELHYEGMLIVEGEQEDFSAIHHLPRRIFAPHPNFGAIWFCDYLFEGDSTEDAVEGFRDLLGLEIAPDDILVGTERCPNSEDLRILEFPLPICDPDDFSPVHTPVNGRRKEGAFLNRYRFLGSPVFWTLLVSLFVGLLAVLVYALLNVG